MDAKLKIPWPGAKANRLNLQLKIYRVNTRSKFKNNIGNDVKVFGIGFGKTGTTSLYSALTDIGYKMGNQAVAETLCEDWYKKRTDRIIAYCHTAHAFQDLPFGLPGLFIELDKAFPDSKFILTVRDSSEQWYNSLTRFATKVFSTDKSRLPTVTDLKNATYRYQGWAFEMQKNFYGYDKYGLYNKDFLIRLYEKHNEDVKEYFRDKPGRLLILNVAEKGSYKQLTTFLGIKNTKKRDFPWKNKT
jgi:hypothetical protein